MILRHGFTRLSFHNEYSERIDSRISRIKKISKKRMLIFLAALLGIGAMAVFALNALTLFCAGIFLSVWAIVLLSSILHKKDLTSDSSDSWFSQMDKILDLPKELNKEALRTFSKDEKKEFIQTFLKIGKIVDSITQINEKLETETSGTWFHSELLKAKESCRNEEKAMNDKILAIVKNMYAHIEEYSESNKEVLLDSKTKEQVDFLVSVSSADNLSDSIYEQLKQKDKVR